MNSVDTIYVALQDPAGALTGIFWKDHLAALFVLALVLLALIFTQLRPKDAKPTPFSTMLTTATDGISSLLAIGLTCTIITLAVTRTPIPQLLSQAFLVVIGYYFGQKAGKASEGGSGRSEVQKGAQRSWQPPSE